MNSSAVRRYVCRSCNRSHSGWVARCTGCLKFDIDPVDEEDERLQGADSTREPSAITRPTPQLVTAASDARATATLVPRSSTPVPLCDVPIESFKRYITNLEPLDRVLGGGLVVGSVIVLGGEPGAGKSTLAMQLLDGVDRRCLYATGEESVAQAAERARRIRADSPKVFIVAETDLDVVFEHARETGADVLLIDSIQTLTCSDINGGAGSIAQMRECANRLVRFAKTEDKCVIVIGHVTHDGTLAGPKTLKHLVDVVLEFELGEGDERIVSCPNKNRFGSTRSIKGRFVITKHGLVPMAPDSEVSAADDDGNDGGSNSGSNGGFH